MELDQVNAIEDTTPETILALSRRIERSRTDEQLIYRESEIDELWRLVDGPGPSTALREIVWDVHEMLAAGGETAGAAAKLRSAL